MKFWHWVKHQEVHTLEAIVTAWSADIAEEVIALVEEEVSEELLLDKV
jgi:hypothetical protein